MQFTLVSALAFAASVSGTYMVLWIPKPSSRLLKVDKTNTEVIAAIMVTAPAANATVDLSKPLQITWNSVE
jgi:hypothetical protein